MIMQSLLITDRAGSSNAKDLAVCVTPDIVVKRKDCNELGRLSSVDSMFQCYKFLGYASDCA